MKRAIAAALICALFSIGAEAAPKKARIADWKFWLTAAVVAGAVMADAATTNSLLRRCPGCRERNSWLYGQRPSTARIYGSMGALAAGEVTALYFIKRWADRNDLRGFYLFPAAMFAAGHGFAAWSNTQIPTCPAQGEGCRVPELEKKP